MKKAVTVIALLVSMFVSISCKDNRVPTKTVPVLRSFHAPAEPQPQPARKWREQDGVIYFSVTSNGKTGEEWIKYLEDKKINMEVYANSVLRHPDFKPTSGVTTEVVVLKGAMFKDNERITNKIRNEAARRNLTTPNAEIACLIRDKFTDKDIEAMGLWWIVAMHDPIKDSGGVLRLLSASRFGRGCGLISFNGGPDDRWSRGFGFAFSVEQVISP